MVAGDLVLEGKSWRSPPLLLALTARTRFRGLRPVPQGRGLLMWSRSVQGWGMRVPLNVVRVGAGGVVLSVHVLRPGRLLWFRQRCWVLEMPGDRHLPEVGSVVRARPSLEA